MPSKFFIVSFTVFGIFCAGGLLLVEPVVSVFCEYGAEFDYTDSFSVRMKQVLQCPEHCATAKCLFEPDKAGAHFSLQIKGSGTNCPDVESKRLGTIKGCAITGNESKISWGTRAEVTECEQIKRCQTDFCNSVPSPPLPLPS